MKLTTQGLLILLISVLLLLVSYAPVQPVPCPTSTPQLSATATITPRPSFTLRPTDTPYVQGTERAIANKAVTQQYLGSWRVQTQNYYDLGYLTDIDGTYRKYPNVAEEWAQIRWYRSWIYEGNYVSNFYISAHFKWSSAYRNADPSSCGFAFAIQENLDKYATFLDRNGILFFIYENSYG